VKYAQTLANWRETHKAPLFLGEFGAIEKAPDTERAVWTAGVRAALESVSIPWCHFDFANGFSAYDRSREAWRPLMLNALLPKGGLTENGS
jgi:endoglucanase